MIKRLLIVVVIALAIIGGLGYFKFKQISAAIAEGQSFELPPEAITTFEVKSQEWQPSLAAIGSAVAVQGVEVTADLAGVVSGVHFESGDQVEKGDLLAELDVTQEEAEKQSAEARLELARVNLSRVQELVEKRATAQADLDEANAEYDQAKASLAEVEARIARKTIRAPFTGQLGLREVNLGEYLNAGEAIVELDALDPIFVRFYVPQQLFDRVRGTKEVEITGAGLDGKTMIGEVSAVNSRVDAATRNVLVEATLDNSAGLLRPGMFVDVRAVMPESNEVLAIPSTAISYAPYGDSVFVVKELTDEQGESYLGVEQVFVTLGETQGDLVAITDGLSAGDVVASSGVFKLKPKGAVQINNDIQPGAARNPSVPDT